MRHCVAQIVSLGVFPVPQVNCGHGYATRKLGYGLDGVKKPYGKVLGVMKMTGIQPTVNGTDSVGY